MEIADVKRRIVDTIERAKRRVADRRVRSDEAGKAYEQFLERTAVPVFRQVANVLKAEGYPFTVFTPAGGVRLMSDRSSEDYIELALDTTGDQPAVSGHTKRGRGGRVLESERAIGDPALLSEDDVLEFVVTELGPLVER